MTAEAETIRTAIGAIANPIDKFVGFIIEREAFRRRRADGVRWPWTDDPILRDYRFCNVQREHDRTTMEIAAMWREPHSADADLWFAMAVARLVNYPPALAELGYPIPWVPDRFIGVMADRKRRGELTEGRAYMIHADNRPSAKGEAKAIYLSRRVLTPLWVARASLRPREGDTCAAVHERLLEHEGMGGFIAAQIIADIKYVRPLSSSPDWWTFAASGPGSRRGLNIVLERDFDATWHERDWRRQLRRLHEDIAPDLEAAGIGRLHAQDLQNCLCEFARYESLRLDLNGARRHQRKYRRFQQDTLFLEERRG